MSINTEKRKCSAVRSDGYPCQAWAVIESDPALCPAHAGLQTGAGAPVGNQNAVKHGLYMSIVKPDEIESLEAIRSKTAMHELVLMRVGLMRLSKYLDKDGLSLADVTTILPLMSTMSRTIVFLLHNIDDSFDWDEVLDELGADWDFEI